jgi:hypothetical protein
MYLPTIRTYRHRISLVLVSWLRYFETYEGKFFYVQMIIGGSFCQCGEEFILL